MIYGQESFAVICFRVPPTKQMGEKGKCKIKSLHISELELCNISDKAGSFVLKCCVTF